MRSAILKMAAMTDIVEISLGANSENNLCGMLYNSDKFHAFMKKCTIFSHIRLTNKGLNMYFMTTYRVTQKDVYP